MQIPQHMFIIHHIRALTKSGSRPGGFHAHCVCSFGSGSFSKTGGLADVVGALPRALAALGHQVSVYLPRYGQTKLADPATVVRSITSPVSTIDIVSASVVSGWKPVWSTILLLSNIRSIFDRDSLYGTLGDYRDNGERFALYSRAVIEASKFLAPRNIFHCHDWQAALIPILLHEVYDDDPVFRVFPACSPSTTWDIRGCFRPTFCRSSCCPGIFSPWQDGVLRQVNFLKGALMISDFVTTVSKKYSQEIQTADFGFGLEGVLKARSATVAGILNGVDYNEWSPEKDKYIARKYSSDDLDGKFPQEGFAHALRNQGSEPEGSSDRHCRSFRSAKGVRPDCAGCRPPRARRW